MRIFFATSAFDEPLRSRFSGALSKIHCSSLLSKMHSSCIFKAGYSTLSVNFGAHFGADSNILTCLATCLADFCATSACNDPLRSIFSGAFSKIHCSSLLTKLHSSCIFKAGHSILSVNFGAHFEADSKILICLATWLADFFCNFCI